MAVSFVNQSQAGTSSITLPASIQAGDFIILFGYRNTTTAPTLATGFTNIANQSANGNAFRTMYKIAVGTESGTSVTVTNANVIQCAVYRGVSRVGGAGSTTNASAGTTTISGIGTMQDTSSASWAVSFAGSLQTTSMSTPTGTTLRGTTQTGTTSMALICDTNAGVSSWAQHTSTNGVSAAGGGGSVELVAIGAKVSTLTDAFDQVTLDTTKWTQTTAGSATMAYASTGATVTYPASSTSSTLGQDQSVALYDLGASSAYAQILAVPTSITSADAEFRLQLDASNWVRWVYEAGTLFAQKFIAASRTNVTSFTYNSTTHKFWRISETAGTISFDTSSDGSSWTSQATLADPFTITALRVMILGSCFQAETSPGTFKWNNFNVSSSVNASVAQVAATVTAAGGTQTVVSVSSSAITQVAGTVTATGGTQTVAAAVNASVTQVAGTVTATGGTQSIATVNNVSIAQSAANVTATGGTQAVASVNIVAITQVAANVTAAGGTQSVSASSNVAITQVAASVTVTGGSQAVDSSQVVGITQVAATVTASGGTQAVDTVNNSTITQIAANVVASGGTQAVDTVNNSSITQVGATITASGGTQTIAAQVAIVVAQQAASVTATGGTQGVSASSGLQDASIAQLAANVIATGGNQVITTSTGPLPRRKYYIDSDANIFWIISESLGLVERI